MLVATTLLVGAMMAQGSSRSVTLDAFASGVRVGSITYTVSRSQDGIVTVGSQVSMGDKLSPSGSLSIDQMKLDGTLISQSLVRTLGGKRVSDDLIEYTPKEALRLNRLTGRRSIMQPPAFGIMPSVAKTWFVANRPKPGEESWATVIDTVGNRWIKCETRYVGDTTAYVDGQKVVAHKIAIAENFFDAHAETKKVGVKTYRRTGRQVDLVVTHTQTWTIDDDGLPIQMDSDNVHFVRA